MALNATLTALASVLLSTTADLAVAQATFPAKYTLTLADGTGANQANQAWGDTGSIAASGTTSLDLAGGLTNVFGATLTFTKIKAILIKAADTNVNDVVLGGAASNGFISWVGGATHTVKIKPGGIFMLTAPDVNGLAVVAGTGDLLQLANGGAGSAVGYDIIIIGVA